MPHPATTVITRAGQPFPGSAFSSPLYRIPALTVTTSGRILIAYDVRKDWRDLPADFDIALTYSDDGEGEGFRYERAREVTRPAKISMKRRRGVRMVLATDWRSSGVSAVVGTASLGVVCVSLVPGAVF